MAPQDAQPVENSLELALELAMYEAVDTALSRSANSAEDAAIGTDHLLFGLLAARPDVERELGRLGLTSHAVRIVSRRPATAEESQASAEDAMTAASPGLPLPPYFFEKMNPVTPSVLAALQRADPRNIQRESGKPAVVALLTALLLDEQGRAADVLSALRVDPEVARDLLQGRPTGRTVDTPAGPGLHADLSRARAVLLGIGFYDARTLRQRFGLGASAFADVNWAETPAEWSVYEAQELAQQDGQRVVDGGDLLRGVLATHEVAHAHPALFPANADHLYFGGRVLIESGLSYGLLTGFRRPPALSHRAMALIRHRKIFGVSVVSAIARAYGGSQASKDGTGPLVLSAIAEGSHGEQLVSAAGADPDDIRRRLRP